MPSEKKEKTSQSDETKADNRSPVKSVPVSNLLAILKRLLNPRLKLTDNYIITTLESLATVVGSLIKANGPFSNLFV